MEKKDLWIIPLVIVLMYISYFVGVMNGYGDSTLNIQNSIDFCGSKGYIMCGYSQENITCGINSCFVYVEDNKLYVYDNPTMELIEIRE